MKDKDAAQTRISFDTVISEDYGDTVVEQNSKPDDVDNDAIQQLVDRFLNKGTLEEDKKTKINKEVLLLINSSKYWSVDNLQPEGSITSLADAQAWLMDYSKEAQKILHQVSISAWNYFVSVSPITKQLLDEAEEALRLFLKATSRQAKQFDIKSLNNAIVGRQLELIMVEGMNSLDDQEFAAYGKIQENINKIFTATDFCENEKQTPCILKFADILPMISTNNDPQQALVLWKNWRQTIGPNMTSIYEQLMKMTNQAAKLNGFENGGQMWRSPYDLSTRNHNKEIDLPKELDRVYEQIKPFYAQLHAYFRRQLGAVYKNVEGITKDGPIPVHLLKSNNGETWVNHYEETKPFDMEDEIPEELLSSFHKKNFTAKSMFTMAYRYIKHLGFEKLPPTFWTKSVFARNWSKDMICHPATAYDMMDGQDYRVKTCAQLGTYPYVTSSNATVGGACTGLGIPPTAVKEVIGVVKAYQTRVGTGPFPTEQLNEVGEKLQQIGLEWGVTTGRKRRCGWLDLILLRGASIINGFTLIALTKLDVLDTFEEIKVAVGYKLDGQVLTDPPAHAADWERIEVEYKSFPGWLETTSEMRSFDELPENCRNYVKFIENFVEVPIGFIGVGASREALIVRNLS
uniref:Adenylosuccinate synthetase n=1 Tax=Acrobeloides nanus TaxID=290746 RepID=A0A914CQT7_9BILA